METGKLKQEILISHCAGGLYMPLDEKTQQTKGFAFIEFATPLVRDGDYCCFFRFGFLHGVHPQTIPKK
jgi:hypothetical protein